MGRPRPRTRIAVAVAAALVLAEGAAVGLVGPSAHAVSATVAAPTLLATSVREAPAAAFAAAAAGPTPPAGHLLVRIDRAVDLTARPGGGRVVGTMPAGSRYYDTPTVAWALGLSRDGRYARVPVPSAGREASGWLPLRGLSTSTTRVSVVADLSAHRIVVRRGHRVLFRASAATGARGSPTPAGRYFVTDRVRFADGGVLGTFAFGISGVQTRLPAGWTGGDQLAIHGTNDPSSIGTSASAGCLRVSEPVLERLKPLLRLGTPVIVRP